MAVANRQLTGFTILLLLSATQVGNLSAATTWTGTNGNGWADTGNWSSGLPVLNATTTFNTNPANRSPDTTGGDRQVQFIQFQAGAGSFDIIGTGQLLWFQASGKYLQVDSGVTANQTISVGRIQARNSGSFLNESTAATLTINSDIIPGTSGSQTLTVGGAGNTTFGGVIGTNNTNRPGGLTKIGGGAVTLSGANIYTQATQVSAGTLVVNGSLIAATTIDGVSGLPVVATPPSNVTVVPTGQVATLAGKGRIDGTVTVGGNSLADTQSAVLSPGDVTTPVATLTVNNAVTFGNYGLLDVQISGDNTDLLAIAGNLDLSSTLDSLNVSIDGVQSLSRYVFATYTGSLTGVFDTVHITGVSGASLDVSQPGELAIVVTTVPEPAALTFALLTACGILLGRRRKGD